MDILYFLVAIAIGYGQPRYQVNLNILIDYNVSSNSYVYILAVITNREGRKVYCLAQHFSQTYLLLLNIVSAAKYNMENYCEMSKSSCFE
jgi:hypothetical protein